MEKEAVKIDEKTVIKTAKKPRKRPKRKMIVNVQPIRSPEQIQEMKKALLKYCSYRDYILFTLGINVGLRVGDLLRLKVRDVTEGTHISLIEEKTGKVRRFLVNNALKKELNKYVRKYGLQPDDYLFKSRKGTEPISTTQAYRVLNKAADMAGVPDIGTHTMRKTYGYWHYKRHKNVAVLQEILNHSSPNITMRYIGINQDVIDETMEDFFL